MSIVRFVAGVAALLAATAASAEPLQCSLAEYTAAPGLTAAVAGDALTLTWDGERNEQVRLRLTIVGGTPTIADLAVRSGGGAWSTLAAGVAPEFRVVSGLRRVSNQQLQPLRALGVEITPEVVDRIKWDAFWDAPLFTSSVPRAANAPGGAGGGNPPPFGGVANQPGLPRKPEEIRRASAVYNARGCSVKTNGARLEATFPGTELGPFAGRLQYTVYKGANLVRIEVVARTDEPSVAYKYDAGLTGMKIGAASRVAWRDLANLWQEYRFGGAKNEDPVGLRASNRIVAVESAAGSIAAFPPPHAFFWAREEEVNLGYSWYRKDTDTTFSFGIQQPEKEHDPRYAENFSLYSARPGTWQRMPMYLYVTTAPAPRAVESALEYTRQDRFKPLPGYQIMATHFHTSMPARLEAEGSLDARLPDLDAMKAVGVNIFAPVDGGRIRGDRLKGLAAYYEAARRHSDKTFLVMPNEESSSGNLGGHTDFLLSKPVFWTADRKDGQPLVEQHPVYGKVYRVGGPDDVMEMARRENMLIFMPHPRSKGSTGFPDAIKDTAHFRHENFRGMGFRWGMGLDGSETRLCEYRCQALLDDMSNWMADQPTPLKHILAITETYEKAPGDDIYANNPVNYVKLAALPGPQDWTPVVDAVKRGDFFVTSGEVLISSYSVDGAGDRRTISADVEWTFPLEFAEVVWGDGKTTDRQIIPATHLPPFGRHQFTIPFDVGGRKWVRFAVWDSAGNGVLVQPIRLTGPTASTSR